MIGDELYEERMREMLAIAKPFDEWQFTEIQLPPYSSLVRQLHKKLSEANHRILNGRLKPVAAFSDENFLKRGSALEAIMASFMESNIKFDDARVGKTMRRYMPTYFLGSAYWRYTVGLARLLAPEIAIGFSSYNEDNISDSEQSLIDFYHARLSLASHQNAQNGYTLYRQLRSMSAKKAAAARHGENREIAERLKEWFTENRDSFPSLDAAAQAAIKIEPVAFRTARKHIGDAAKELRSARKE